MGDGQQCLITRNNPDWINKSRREVEEYRHTMPSTCIHCDIVHHLCKTSPDHFRDSPCPLPIPVSVSPHRPSHVLSYSPLYFHRAPVTWDFSLHKLAQTNPLAALLSSTPAKLASCNLIPSQSRALLCQSVVYPRRLRHTSTSPSRIISFQLDPPPLLQTFRPTGAKRLIPGHPCCRNRPESTAPDFCGSGTAPCEARATRTLIN